MVAQYCSRILAPDSQGILAGGPESPLRISHCYMGTILIIRDFTSNSPSLDYFLHYTTALKSKVG